MLYASSINKDRSYLDLVLRTDRLSTSSKTYGALSDSSDFSTRGYSASLEYGKKFALSNPEVYFQPEIQLAYGHLAAKDYTSANGISAKLDASNSLLGRIGFKLGKYFDQHRNNVYLKGSLLHYFQGDQQIGLNSGAADSFQYTSSAKGTSYLVGAGFDVDFTDNSRFYGEVEKSFGGDLKTDWAFQLGLKFMF